MTPLGRALSRIAGDLTESKNPFALVGGLAVSARTEPRFTRDADITVTVDSDEQGVATDSDLNEARAAMALIVKRGYARGRDLLGDMASLRF